MMLSDVCLSVAYIGPKSRSERSRKTKIGTEVAHVTRTLFLRSKVGGWGICGGLPHRLLLCHRPDRAVTLSVNDRRLRLSVPCLTVSRGEVCNFW